MLLKVAGESKGLLRLTKFTKTNGQKSVVNGIEMYTMECSAEVAANEDCALTGFQFGGGWNGTFAALKAEKKSSSLDAFNPMGAAYGTNKQLSTEARMTFNTNLVFDLTERGWRTEGGLPADSVVTLQQHPYTPPAQETTSQKFPYQFAFINKAGTAFAFVTVNPQTKQPEQFMCTGDLKPEDIEDIPDKSNNYALMTYKRSFGKLINTHLQIHHFKEKSPVVADALDPESIQALVKKLISKE